MKVLFGNDDSPTEIKDTELFNRMEKEAWVVGEEVIYDAIDELTGKFVDKCFLIHLYSPDETHLVGVYFATDILYGEYKKVD